VKYSKDKTKMNLERQAIKTKQERHKAHSKRNRMRQLGKNLKNDK